ncbi:MAG: hypothetical protein L6R00_18280 [Phycisphaerae bacterium]|nr:hypothetical protein [Phycisphaerae bacterium]
MERALVTFTIGNEPRNSIYDCLLRFVALYCDRFGLVCRPELSLGTSANNLLQRITPFFIESRLTERWPGTLLLDSRATVSIYRLCDASLAILLETTHSLFDWMHPALPEDLFMLRHDGSWMLASISHERDAFVVLSDTEYRNLVATCPDLMLHKSESDSGAVEGKPQRFF